MKQSRWDERCPHCGKKINCHEWFTAKDYSTNFEFACDHCGKSVECTVHSVPEFELEKAETLEEYQARRKRLLESTKDVIQQIIMEDKTT